MRHHCLFFNVTVSQIGVVSLSGFVAVCQGLCEAKHKRGTSAGRTDFTGNFGENITPKKKNREVKLTVLFWNDSSHLLIP